MPDLQSSGDFGEKLAYVWQWYKLPLGLGGASVIVIGISLILLVKSIQTTTPIEFSSNKDTLGDSTQSASSDKKMIHVDVEGGVRAPGVYILPLGSRIDDAIAKANGLSEEADTEMLAKRINRASILVDGAKIYVPKKEETSDNPSPLLQHENMSQNGLININTASQNELENLPGVGPVTAKKIIDNRPYQTLEELVSKKALTKSLFEKLENSLTL